MKDISSLRPAQNSDTQSTLVSNDVKENITNNNIEPVNNTEVEIGAYMLTDSNFVGYESLDQQEQIYKMATYGVITPNTNSVLELGCGRADLGSYIIKTINKDIKYIGIDVNSLMINIANEKYNDIRSDNWVVIHENYYNLKNQIEKYPKLISDWVLNITNITVPYGFHNGDKWEQLYDLIDISLEYSIHGCVFMLLNDKTEYNGFHQYNTSELIKRLESMNLRYAIDNTDLKDVFKLVIFKQEYI